ncbi:acyl-CoA dehydrogenase family protein [Actinospica durhamensis]|uniref:Acyl-CoA dehydrogenase family protein n=1 Tax=Actinospica durhamensis TaxID=1508375 RepID=A0A941INC9_9ACTN|nr:acyl-CoA dehydrogenase family protein [Actinospica durhamensis]MBR7831882.1 acyl-CoA dehydrogenase family protein [Actinospica durhamensis]
MTTTDVLTQRASASAEQSADTADHGELVLRAAALRECLGELAPRSDAERRLPRENLAALREAGLLRLFTPARWGGHEIGFRTYLEVISELGRGCCSSAWVTGVLNAGNLIVASFGEKAQAEVWSGSPDATTAFFLGRPTAPVERTTDGVVLTGSWPYFSGSLHSDWMIVVVAAGAAAGEPGPHLALIPATQVNIEDTWQMGGMRGTGSNTVLAESVFVPEHRLLPFECFVEGTPNAPEVWRRKGLAGLSVGLLGALIGGVDTALDFVLERGAHRPVAATTYKNQTASPSFRLDLADAATRLDTAKLHARRIAEDADALVATQAEPSARDRARSRMDAAYVARNCREAIEILMTAHGSSAFAEASPLQRIWRDVNVGSRHAAFGMGIPQQVYGSALVEDDPRRISFLD